MPASGLLERNRLIFCHFDSYSTALRFVRINDSVMLPAPLPENARMDAAPTDTGDTPTDVLHAVLEKLNINSSQIEMDDGFEAWLSTDIGPIRIHVARFTTFEAPHEAIAPHGGVFKPISELRRLPMTELTLLRKVFDLVMGG
ncbi:hypothetical protein [Acidithiobacillus sp.]|uniref:hypothetical protein n=1 Tax=Acidithiobacillus sp. TaxID=1872118 RepID=UPI003CFC5529